MKNLDYMPPNASLQGYSTVPATSDAKEYLRLLLKHKLGILLMMLLGVLLAFLYLISATQIYQASALLEVKDSQNLIDDKPDAIDFNAPTVKEEANILRSRKVLSPVVDLYDLQKSIEPRTVPVVGDLARVMPVVGDWVSGFGFAENYAWEPSTLEISRLDVPRQWEDSELIVTALENGQFSLHKDGQTVIEQAQIGEALRVEMSTLDPVELVVTQLEARPGVQFTVIKQSLQETLSDLQQRLRTETSDSKTRMITVSLEGREANQTTDLLNAIIQKYRDVKLGSESRASLKELEFFEQTMPTVKRDLEEAEAALARFRSTRGSINQDLQNNAKLRQLDKLDGEMIELQLEKEELKKRYSELHPSTRQLDKKIIVLEEQINKLRGQVRSAPNTERELTTLEEREKAARKLFNEMNEKLQKIRVAQAGHVGSVQIWDPALTPKKPISPKPLLALVAATVTTLFLYLVFLTLRSALSTVINDQESLERASGLPVFINIPRSNAQKRLAASAPLDPRRLLPGTTATAPEDLSANVLAVQKPEDYSVENMRGLRLMLEDVMDGATNNVLMICSPLPSMGKSFVSANLAVLLAQSGKRILLIDADYQRGQQHKSFGLQMGPGLPEVVTGKSQLKETVKATSVPNLYAIPRGFSGDGIARETPGGKEFGAFLQVVAPRFDMVIIDTPPILSVSTAATLGKHAGASIMVVKEGEIKEPQLNEALKRLSFSGVRVSGCLMNSSSQPTPSHYAYYREQLD
ncbi:MAG: AAA family ATPase [Gammaproteobacteria bacterium]|nr:AAA family ATPase [Gammaproteobacteria bacterium]